MFHFIATTCIAYSLHWVFTKNVATQHCLKLQYMCCSGIDTVHEYAHVKWGLPRSKDEEYRFVQLTAFGRGGGFKMTLPPPLPSPLHIHVHVHSPLHVHTWLVHERVHNKTYKLFALSMLVKYSNSPRINKFTVHLLYVHWMYFLQLLPLTF